MDGWRGREREREGCVTTALTSALVYSALTQVLCFVCACLSNGLCLPSLRIAAKKDEEGASRPALLCECLHPQTSPPLNGISPLAVSPPKPKAFGLSSLAVAGEAVE